MSVISRNIFLEVDFKDVEFEIYFTYSNEDDCYDKHHQRGSYELKTLLIDGIGDVSDMLNNEHVCDAIISRLEEIRNEK